MCPRYEDAADDLRRLIRDAQAGSQEAYAALRQQYAPLVQAQLRRFLLSCRTKQEQVDLTEEAEYAFLSAVSSYDTEQDEVSFGLYARVCIHNGLVSEIRHLETLRRLPVVPLPEHTPEARADVAADVASDEQFAGLCCLVRESLSAYENRVWWAYVAGTPVSQIASELGRDEKSVYNAIYRIRQKLRRRLERSDG